MEDNSHNRNTPYLPVDILYDICLQVLIRFVDDLVTGPLKLQPPANPSIDITRFELPDDELAILKSEIEENDVARTSPNPISALLGSSFQLRDVTLNVVSQIMSIELKGPEGGLRQ